MTEPPKSQPYNYCMLHQYFLHTTGKGLFILKETAFKYNTKLKVENLRKLSQIEIFKIMENIKSNDDKDIYIKWLFYLGDVEYGFGKRDLLETGLLTLTDDPLFFMEIIKYIPIYSRWDVLVDLAWDLKEGIGVEIPNSDECLNMVLSFIKYKLYQDIWDLEHGLKNISLLAKWLPSINTSSDLTRAKAGMIRQYLNISAKEYRTILKNLRDALDVMECKMSSNRWSEIDVNSIPTIASKRYSNALSKHNIKKEVSGEDKEVEEDNKYIDYSDAEEHEKKLREYLESTPVRTQILPILDCSGVIDSILINAFGINTTAKAIGAALSLHLATGLKGRLKDTVFTAYDDFSTIGVFREDPEKDLITPLVSNGVRTFTEDPDRVAKHTSKINSRSLFNKILNYVDNYNIKSKEVPNTLLLITGDARLDMSDKIASVAATFKRKYGERGYKMPKVIVWYIHEIDQPTIKRYNHSVPTVLIDGYSDSIVKTLLRSGYDPWENFKYKLNDQRYDQLNSVISAYRGGTNNVE